MGFRGTSNYGAQLRRWAVQPNGRPGPGGEEIYRAVYYEELSSAMLRVPEQHMMLKVIGQLRLKCNHRLYDLA